tara:strand:+ start:5130 stop:5411 length:282 start_codon:yes stop_codon:yes gene_type:complete
MKISRMNKGSWGKVVAFFDLETSEGFTLKGFKLVEGSDGLFVGYPSVKNKDDKYDLTVFADKELKSEVHQMAIDYFNQEQSSEPQKPDFLEEF